MVGVYTAGGDTCHEEVTLGCYHSLGTDQLFNSEQQPSKAGAAVDNDRGRTGRQSLFWKCNSSYINKKTIRQYTIVACTAHSSKTGPHLSHRPRLGFLWWKYQSRTWEISFIKYFLRLCLFNFFFKMIKGQIIHRIHFWKLDWLAWFLPDPSK